MPRLFFKKLADLIVTLSELGLRRKTESETTEEFTPVVIGGSIDAGGTFHAGSVGITAKPIADVDLANQGYALTMDHSRKLSVKDSRWWDWVPEGRTVFEDKFANAISWVQAVGTAAYSAVRPYPGNANCLRLTTGALAGNQAQATLGLFRLADAQSRGFGGGLQGDGPKIWYGVLFKNTDANLAFIELGVQLFDGASQLAARVRLTYPSGQLSVLNTAGGYTNQGTPVALSTSERWHWLGMELHYQSGQVVLFYSRLRIDDTTVDLTPFFGAQGVGAAAVSETLLEITVQNNAAVVEICDIGYVVCKDLTNVRQILG